MDFESDNDLADHGSTPADEKGADSGGCRSAFQSDVDHDSEVMPISVPN